MGCNICGYRWACNVVIQMDHYGSISKKGDLFLYSWNYLVWNYPPRLLYWILYYQRKHKKIITFEIIIHIFS